MVIVIAHRIVRFIWAVLFFSLFATHSVAQITTKYAGQVFVQRTFYRGSHLIFDDQGNPVKTYTTCPWTLCAKIRVVDVSVDGETLHIRGERLYLVSDGQNGFADVFSVPRFAAAGESFEQLKKQRDVEIEVRRHHGWDDAAIAGLLEKLFIRAEDGFDDVLPEYWKSCAFTNPNSPCGENPVAKSTLRVGDGITPPRPIHAPDPKYSEPARLAKYQGTTVLWLIVTPEGSASNIRIKRALGLGLDDEAVRAVSGWKFQPATKAGEPVAVQVNIEVNFRLY